MPDVRHFDATVGFFQFSLFVPADRLGWTPLLREGLNKKQNLVIFPEFRAWLLKILEYHSGY